MNRTSTFLLLSVLMAACDSSSDESSGGNANAGGDTSVGASNAGGEAAAGASDAGGTSSDGGAASTGEGGTTEPAGGSNGEGAGPAEGDPTIEVTATPNSIAAGETTQLTIAVTNFELDQPGGANEDGHGHYHVYLDDATGGDYLTNGSTPTVMVEIPANTPAGAHTLRINLTDNNHKPFNPSIEDIVDITVL